MKQTLFEQNGGTYTKQGDYYLPDIKLLEQPEYEIGVWGNRRRQYLKHHHRVKYYNMLTQCTLYPHLTDVEQQAQRLFDDLADQIAKQKGISEKMKAENPILWIQIMNNIRHSVTETINNNLIFK